MGRRSEIESFARAPSPATFQTIFILAGNHVSRVLSPILGRNIAHSCQDANGAWRTVMFIAQNLKASVEVSFIRRNKEGVENPGKTGSMRFG
jgi:hypothetical protein